MEHVKYKRGDGDRQAWLQRLVLRRRRATTFILGSERFSETAGNCQVRKRGSPAQSCPVLSLQKFHFIPDWDFLGPSWGQLSLPLPTRAQNRAFPAFVQPPFCSLPFCSTFILSSRAEQSQIMPALLLCDILKISRGKKYTLAEIF